MNNIEADKARKKIQGAGEVTLRWNGVHFVPDKLIDHHILEMCGEKRGRYTEAEIDWLLSRLSEHDLGIHYIGLPNDNPRRSRKNFGFDSGEIKVGDRVAYKAAFLRHIGAWVSMGFARGTVLSIKTLNGGTKVASIKWDLTDSEKRAKKKMPERYRPLASKVNVNALVRVDRLHLEAHNPVRRKYKRSRKNTGHLTRRAGSLRQGRGRILGKHLSYGMSHGLRLGRAKRKTHGRAPTRKVLRAIGKAHGSGRGRISLMEVLRKRWRVGKGKVR